MFSLEGGASASSSVDLNSHAQQDIGGKKDMEIMREDFNRLHMSRQSSVSGFPYHCCEDNVYSEGMAEVWVKSM